MLGRLSRGRMTELMEGPRVSAQIRTDSSVCDLLFCATMEWQVEARVAGGECRADGGPVRESIQTSLQ